MRKIARAGSVNTIGAALGAVLSIAFTWLVAHRVAPGTAGAFFTATSVFLVAVAVAELGSDVSLSRFVPTFLARGQVREARFVIALSLVAAFGAGGLAAGAVLLLRDRIGEITGGGRAMAAALVLLALALPAATVMNTALAAARGLGTIRPTVLVDQLGRNAFQFLLVALVTLGGGSLRGLGAAWALPYLAGALVALGLLRRFVPKDRAAEPEERNRRLIADYVSFTWPRAISRVSQILLQRADIVLVAVLRSPTEAAVYTVATRFLVIGQIIVQAVQQVLAPHTSRLLGTGEAATAVSVFQLTTAWVMALTWPVYLLAVAAADPMLRLFGGDSYTAGATVVAVLAAATLVSSAFGPVDVVLLMLGRSGFSLLNSLLALSTNLAVDLLLIPRLGIEGAAIGWASAIVVRNLLGLWFVHRELRATMFSRSTLLVGALNLLVLGVPGVFAGRVLGVGGSALVLILTVCGLVYLAGLGLLRGPLGLSAFTALRPRTPHRPTAALPSRRPTG